MAREFETYEEFERYAKHELTGSERKHLELLISRAQLIRAPATVGELEQLQGDVVDLARKIRDLAAEAGEDA